MVSACSEQLALMKNHFGFPLHQRLHALAGPLPSTGELARRHNP